MPQYLRYFITKKIPRLNSHGLSLAELMIAAGVMGIIALFTGHIISDMLVTKNTAAFYSTRHSIRSDLNTFLLKNNTCRCSFNNLIIPGNISATDTPFRINSLDIYTDPDAPNCNSAIKKNVIREGDIYDRTEVISLELGRIQRLTDRQFLSHLVATVESKRKVLGPKLIPLDLIIPLQVEDVGGGAYKITGCGQQPPDEFKVIDGGLTQNLRGGTSTYTFPNLSGRTLGLVQFDFRSGKNFTLRILNPITRRQVLDTYQYETGQDGHIRHGTFMALIPLNSGQFTADFDCNCGRNARNSTMTLIATIPVL